MDKIEDDNAYNIYKSINNKLYLPFENLQEVKLYI